MTPADLRAWRHQHGYSQAQLARLLGVPVLAIKRWEAGAHAPTGKLLDLALERLAEAALHDPAFARDLAADDPHGGRPRK